MFWILFSFLLLQILVVENDCAIVYKSNNPDNNEFNMLYTQIINPLKRLAEMLPDHNLEVQLEMLGSNQVPLQTTRLNFVHQRNLRQHVPHVQFIPQHIPNSPQHEYRLREIDPIGPIKITTPWPIAPATSWPAAPVSQWPLAPPMASVTPPVLTYTLSPSFNQMNPFQQFSGYNTINRGLLMKKFLESSALAASNPKPHFREGPTTAPDSTTKKPLYMNDLKEIFNEFLKRFFDKQNQQQLNTDSEKTQVVEEGKKPVLKKDLWMAMGLKFMTGCPYQGMDHTTSSPNIIPIGTTKNFIKINNGNIPKSITEPNILKILQLLKDSVNVDRGPNKDNIQWLQVRIPKK